MQSATLPVSSVSRDSSWFHVNAGTEIESFAVQLSLRFDEFTTTYAVSTAGFCPTPIGGRHFYRSILHRLLIPQLLVGGACYNDHTSVALSQPSRLFAWGKVLACRLPARRLSKTGSRLTLPTFATSWEGGKRRSSGPPRRYISSPCDNEIGFVRRAAASSKSRAARQAPRSPRKVRSPKGSVPANGRGGVVITAFHG
jgi:hypothetical protein